MNANDVYKRLASLQEQVRDLEDSLSTLVLNTALVREALNSIVDPDRPESMVARYRCVSCLASFIDEKVPTMKNCPTCDKELQRTAE